MLSAASARAQQPFEVCGQGPERGSEDGSGAREGEHVAEGARGQGNNRTRRRRRGSAGAVEDSGDGVGIGDDLEDTDAVLAAGLGDGAAAENGVAPRPAAARGAARGRAG